MTFRKGGEPEQGQHRILDAVRIRWRNSRGHSGLRVISGCGRCRDGENRPLQAILRGIRITQ
jgi:hypothetical protein